MAAFNLGDVLVTFVANVEGMVAGLQEVAAASAEVAGVATKDLEEVGIAGKEAGVGIAEGGAAAEGAAGGFSLLGGSMLETLAPLIAVLGAYEGLKAIVEGANTATNEWNNAQVQVKNSLSQTGDAIGLTSEQIDKMAEAYSKSTPITKGAQLQGEATLLTYQAIGKDIFPQVAKILPDVATAFANVQGRAVATSEDVAQASKKIGVALTDPEKGVNALTRAGIKFTAAQQDVIKKLQESGDVVGAQKQLLSDFADMTAGKATASLNTYQGAVANAKKQFDDWTGNAIRFAQTELEKLGNTLLVFAVKIMPDVQKAGKWFVETFGPAIRDVAGFIKDLAFAFGLVIETLSGGDPTLRKNQANWSGFASFLINDLKPALDDVMTFFHLVYEVISGGDPTLRANQTQFVGIVKALLNVKAAVITVAENITKYLLIAWQFLKVAVDALMPSITALLKAFVENVKPAVVEVWQAVVSLWNALNPALGDALKVIAVIAGVVLVVALYITINAFRIAIEVSGFLVHAITDVIKWIADFIGWLGIGAVWVYRFSDAVAGAIGDVIGWFIKLPGMIQGAIGDAETILLQIGKDIITGLIHGLDSMVGAVTDKVKSVANGIKDVAKKILGIFSPSTVFHEIGQNIGQGMANGINSMQDVVSNAAAGMASATLVGANGSFSGSSLSGGGYGSGFTVSLDGAQIIGAVPQDVAEKIGDAIVGKLKRTVRI